MGIVRLCAVWAAGALACYSAKSTFTLEEGVDGADVIVLASYAGSRAIDDPRGLPGPRGNLAGLSPAPCLLEADVRAVVKGALPARSLRIQVLSYLRQADCRFELGGTPVGEGQSLIFLLRLDQGRLRSWVDNYGAFIPVADFSRGEIEAATAYGNARMAVAYFLLMPGMGRSASGYADRVDFLVSEIAGTLLGMDQFWSLMDGIYRRADAAARDQICLVASNFGACIACARSAIASGKVSLPPRDFRYHYISPAGFDYFTTQRLSMLSPSSLAKIRRTFSDPAPDVMKGALYWDACTSSRALRARARELLRQVYHVDPDGIRCIPCDAHLLK